MEKEDIKAVIFDIGGVIYIGDQQSHSHMQEQMKLSKEKWFNAINNVWESLVIGKINNEIGLKIMSENLGIPKEKLRQLWVKTFKIRFILNKPLLLIIKKLKKKYKTAILSNQWFIPYKILINKDIKKNFNVMIFSHKVGVRKPDLAIYRETIKKLKLKPKQCIFIDNQEWNLSPAKKLGMKTILFKDNKQLIKDLKKFGVKV